MLCHNSRAWPLRPGMLQVLSMAVECQAGVLLSDETFCKAFQVSGLQQLGRVLAYCGLAAAGELAVRRSRGTGPLERSSCVGGKGQ